MRLRQRAVAMRQRRGPSVATLMACAVAMLVAIGVPASLAPVAAVEAGLCSVTSGTGLEFTSSGVTRTFDIRVPEGSTPSTAMVMSLHGSDGTAGGQQELSGFSDNSVVERPRASALAREQTTSLGMAERFIVVFPQALSGPQGNQWDLRPDGLDVRFLADLAQWLHDSGCSRPDSTSVTGFSMGSMMASRLICAAPDRFSGLGMVSGVYPPSDGCVLPQDTSVVGMHGTGDWLVNWDGWVWPSMEDLGMESFPFDRAEMVRQWSQVKGCHGTARATFLATTADDYFGCDGGAVHMVTFVGGQHDWDTYSMNTSTYLWSVLRPHQRNPVHSAGQALMQAMPSDAASGQVQRFDGGSVVAVDAGAPDATVVGTLTATGGQRTGFVTAFPCGQVPPVASNVNFAAAESVASGVTVRTGSDGRFCVYSPTAVHMVWDQVAETELPSHSPQRRLDTREVFGVGSPPPAGSVVAVDAGVPNATVVGTLTVTGSRGSGYVTAFPCGQVPRVASNVNFTALQSVASGAVVRTDAKGRFCVFVSNAVHVVWDQVAETDLPGHPPERRFDTRESLGVGSPPAAGSVVEVNSGAPDSTVTGTLTVTGGRGSGYVTAYPCGDAPPNASNVNFTAYQSVASGVVVRTDDQGRFCVYVSNTVHVVWDQVAETDLPSHAPARLMDTRRVTASW